MAAQCRDVHRVKKLIGDGVDVNATTDVCVHVFDC